MKKSLFSLFIFIFTLPVFAGNTILIIGDSLSAGYGVETGQGWVALLDKALQEENDHYKVINASISGDTTSNGLSRLPNALQQYKPQVTVIELGGNDGLRGIPLAVIKKNLMHMIELAKSAGSKVLILGVRLPPNYGPSYVDQFHAIFTDLTEDTSVSVVPLFLQNVDNQSQLMQPDGIHPTAKAQAIMFNNIWPKLKPLLQ